MCITKDDLEYAINVAGSIEAGSKRLGVSRSYMYRLAKQYGLVGKVRRIEIDTDILKAEYEKGTKVDRLAEMFYVSENTIRRRLAELGLKKYELPELKIDKMECIGLLRQGKTNSEIAEHFGTTITRIRTYIKNNGLKGYRKKKVLVSDVSQTIEQLSAKGCTKVKCKAQKISKVKKSCLYGGHCGGYDCCDYLMLTGKRREFDPENPEICYCYVHVTEAEKRKIETAKTRQNQDILIT